MPQVRDYEIPSCTETWDAAKELNPVAPNPF